jgi:hypothetical protein
MNSERHVARHNIYAEWPAPIDPILARGEEFERPGIFRSWRTAIEAIIVVLFLSGVWSALIVIGTRHWKH